MRARAAEVRRPIRLPAADADADAFVAWVQARPERIGWTDLRMWRACPPEWRSRLRRVLHQRHVRRNVGAISARGDEWGFALEVYEHERRRFQARAHAQLMRRP